MSDVSHSRHRQALWCRQCRRLLYDFLRQIRYSALLCSSGVRRNIALEHNNAGG